MNTLLELGKMIKDNFFEISAFVIASISLYLSLKNSKKSIMVDWSDIQPIERGSIYYVDNTGEEHTYRAGLLLRVEIVNPSPNDIAYFDLRAFNTETNINCYLLTRKSFLEDDKNLRIWRRIPTGEFYELDIPNQNYGVFKANSFTRFELFIEPKVEVEELAVSFKVAVKSWFKKDIYSVTRRKQFKFYGIQYNITDWYNDLIDKSQFKKEGS